ncbi:MAG: spondin domain-containing protein [Kofleriaceae bacterium]
MTIENVTLFTASQSGGLGLSEILPGESRDIQFTAGRSDRLSFATELAESSDWFLAPNDRGIALYDDKGPISGDITSLVHLWTLGTELPEELGVGPDTKANQSSELQGVQSQYPYVTQIPDGEMFCLPGCETRFAVPKVSDMFRATLTSTGPGTFSLHFENISTDTTLVTRAGTQAIHLSAPVWAVHPEVLGSPIFREKGGPTDQSMIAFAEDGDNTQLVSHLMGRTGEGTPLGKAVYAIHQSGQPLYTPGEKDRGLGLEQLAEDGDPTRIAASLAADHTVSQSDKLVAPFNTGVQGPLQPGDKFELFLEPQPGDRLSFASMFGTSNDWFFATQSDGVPFFNDDGTHVVGQIPIVLLDLGTEVDEPLRYGPDTGPMQSSPGQGAADPNPMVRGVDNRDNLISVTFDTYEIAPE